MKIEGASSADIKKDLSAINTFIDLVAGRHKVSFAEVISFLEKKQDKIAVPTFILRHRALGVLESITKYLKENLGFKFSEIARILKRDDRVVWASYKNALKKRTVKFTVKEPNVWVPVDIFLDSDLGFLEVIVKYLKEEHNLRFSEIGSLLNRNDRTIWTSYNNAVKKSKR